MHTADRFKTSLYLPGVIFLMIVLFSIQSNFGQQQEKNSNKKNALKRAKRLETSKKVSHENSGSQDLPQATRLRFENLMPAFWGFWKVAEGKDSEVQIRLFREKIIEPNRQLYAQVVGEISDRRLKEYFSELPALIPAIRRRSRDLPDILPKYWRDFKRRFPEAKEPYRVYILTSLFAFDGQARPMNEKRLVVLFGTDAMAQLPGEKINPALIQHEFFHHYHMQTNPELRRGAEDFFISGKPPELFYLLWIEGLATYVIKILNPKATLPDIFLSETLVGETQAVLPKLSDEIRNKLGSNSFQDLARYFFKNGNPNKSYPDRSGYYVGFSIAEKLA